MASLVLLATVLLNFPNLFHSLFLPKVDPEVYMNISEIIKYNGYPCEDRTVVTEDGYILSLQRIAHGKMNNLKNGEHKPVVFLQHGLLDSAHTWVNNLPNQSLAYILADEGFDVWLGNSRGTTYSKKHTHLNPKKLEYWKFSWDEMAKYDLPACIYYILTVTNSTRLSYIGHSQGTEIAFAQFSQDAKLAAHISSFTALGPVITTAHVGWGPYLTMKTVTQFSTIFNALNHGEFFQNNKLLEFLGSTLCAKRPLSAICSNAIFWMAGFDIGNLNDSRLPVIIAHTPAGTSIQNLLHYNQGLKSGKFQMYDFGSLAKNIEKYGTSIPPLYNVTRLQVPSSIYWGGKDILADPTDVANLIPLIQHTLKRKTFIPHYNHMDYMWGMDAATLIYPDMIDFIRSEL